MEQTLAIIKPDAVRKGVVLEIEKRIRDGGLIIFATRKIHLTRERAEAFYAEHRGKAFFDVLVSFMSSGPSMVMVLEGVEAIANWRRLMGATNPRKAEAGTIRGDLGRANEREEENVVHGSDSPASARREIAFFFSDT